MQVKRLATHNILFIKLTLAAEKTGDVAWFGNSPDRLIVYDPGVQLHWKDD